MNEAPTRRLAADLGIDGYFAAMLPGIVGIAGTLFLGWGMTLCVLLTQTSTPAGVYNAVKPLLDEHKEQKKLLA